MGYALFVMLNHHIPGTEGWDMDGKALARNIEKLDDVAKQLKLTSLGEMISVSEEYLGMLLDEEIENCVQEQWFNPAEGLATVDSLTNFVQKNSESFDQGPQLLEDLSKLKQYLSSAKQHNTLFHLTPDF